MEPPLIRTATLQDLEAVNAIYNHYVIHSTTTYQMEPETAQDRRTWFEAHGPTHPVTVAETQGEILGWASLSPFHRRAAYCHTVENSVYVRHDALRRGVGSRLLEDLIRRATDIGHHVIIAGIDAEQAGSLRLHARFGFTEVGHLREVGFKLGHWLDVIYMQRILGR